jgi:hypothetical protein
VLKVALRIALLLMPTLTPGVAAGADGQFEPTGIGFFDHIEPSFLLFGDVYWIPEHHLEDWRDQSGWWSRRIYATLDFKDFGLGEKTVMRLRLELNQSDDFDEVSYKAKFKDWYLEFDAGGHAIQVGHSSTVTFDLIEKVWGYRWFERTPLDVQGVPSRQTGIAARGMLTGDGRWRYRALAGFGDDLGSDSDDTGKIQAAVSYVPSEQWLFDFYLDYLDSDAGVDCAYSMQAFAAWTGADQRAGLQWFLRRAESSDTLVHLASAYYVRDYRNVSLVGRVDRLFVPSFKGNGISYIPFDPTARATYLLAGVDFPVHPNVNLMPNVKTIIYDDQGDRPDNDLIVGLTLNVEL